MPTITKNQIIFDHRDWLAGLATQSNIGIPVLFNGFRDIEECDPFRNIGAIQPGMEFDAVTNSASVTTMLRNGAIGKSGAAYAVGGDLLHKITISTSAIVDVGTSPATGAFPHQVANATMSDIIRYDDGTGNYMYYSYNDSGGNSNIGRMKLSDESFVDSYLIGVLSGTLVDTAEHPMIVGDDDILYVGNGNTLLGIDGATLNQTALTLPRDHNIKSFAKLSNRILVVFTEFNPGGTGARGQVTAWLWNYVDEDPDSSYEVYGGVCGGAFNVDNTIGVFTSGLSYDRGESGKSVHLNIFDGAKFNVMKSIEKDTVPIHGGVEVFGGMIYANIESDLYSFGSPYRNVQAGMHVLSSVSGSGSGMLRTFDDGVSDQLISSSTGMQKADITSYVDNASFRTGFANPEFPVGMRGQITKVRVEFLEAATAGRQFELILNDTNTSRSTIMTASTVSGTKLTYEVQEGQFAFKLFNMLQAEVSWSTGTDNTDAPKVRRIIVDYKPVEYLEAQD